MTTLQTLEMALEALEPDRNRDHWEVARDRQKAITDIRQQIALLKQQSADEPVAWMHNMIEGVAVTHKPLDLERHPERWAALYKNPMPCKTCEALARTVMMDQTGHDTRPQPAAQWVGLTDEEQQAAYAAWQQKDDGWGSFYALIEAKLKEKNT